MKKVEIVDCDTISQISTFGAIIEGCLDGFIPLEETCQYGDFGIGTITGLDGELLCLDGVFYYFSEDGHTTSIADNVMVPRMTVAFFCPQKTVSLSSCESYKDFEDIFESSIPTKNIMYAIKITGRFNWMKTKCFPKQQKPYPHGGLDLATAIKFREMSDVDGAMVGFFTTDYFNDISFLKYHFHFISADKRYGGHVMDFRITSAEMEIDPKHNMKVILPKTEDYYRADLSNALKNFHNTVTMIKKRV